LVLNRRRLALSNIKRIPYIFLFFLITACSAGSSQRHIVPLSSFDGANKVADIQVFTQNQELRTFVQEVRTTLATNLNSRRVFGRAGWFLDNSDYTIKVEIIGGKSVSEDSRIAFGGLAGRARIKLRVNLFETGSDQPLGVVEVDGNSSGGTMFAGTNDDAIENAVLEIVFWLQSRRPIKLN